MPGGWDFQLTYSASDCTQLSADYLLKADDGTLIRLEAPKGAHEWLTRATFVATLELEPPVRAPPPGVAPTVEAVRIRVYQVN